MRTIQEIENLDLNKLDKAVIVQIRSDLLLSFYHTKSSELSSDKRCLKDVIGLQLTRFTDFLMGNKNTQWTKYAKKHNCSIIQSIADRDEPMNRQECIQAYVESTGNNPSDDEIVQMNPDSKDAIQRQLDYYRE